MILADTSILIDLLRGDEETQNRLQEFDEDIATCFPVECELYRGTKLARRTKEGEKKIDNLLKELKELDAGKKCAKIFSELKNEYEINDFDLMIASICIANKSSIVTNDRDFQKIERLNTKEISP